MESSLRIFLGILVALLVVDGSYGKDSYKTQSLDGTWIAKDTSNYYEFPATVPGGIYTDLMNVNIFDDVFYLYNDNSTRWAGKVNWTYALNFTIHPDILSYDQVNLVFEGVDTFSEIILNNVSVGVTDNMFVRYVFDVKNVLKSEGNNTLKVFFQSPIEVGLKRNIEQLIHYRIPWECPPDEYHGECHINMIRKMQASFSWDWGPAFPSVGLWKPVYIQAYDVSVIDYVVSQVTEADSDSWAIMVDTYFANNKKNNVTGNLRITLFVDGNGFIIEEYSVNEAQNQYNETVKSVVFNVYKNKVKLWWPNGYGSQPLYDLKVDFLPATGSSWNSKKVQIGFRTVETVQDDLASGATFYFKVNGIPVFAKGSNEILLNVLPELGQDKETIRYILQSAADVHMNMLRVWGGGVYESDYFYEVADKLGIMIWQDFMFGCSLYPVKQDFLDSVVAEVNHNVKRIYHHPSIVIYSGNNENEAVLADNWYNTNDNYDLYKRDYVTLYIDTIRKEFDRLTKNNGIYVSSSPSNGKKTETEGWVSKNPGDEYWGDMHYYNYVLDPWDSNTYPIPRFCSEYGYQSFPFEDSWKTATNNTEDLKIGGKFMEWRQHHPLGNAEILVFIEEQATSLNQSSKEYFSSFIYFSQVLYAQAIKIETEHYRRYRSYLDDQGRGYTMGALYWQLNDVWVAPTWSSIDYTGRWKMLHYFARDMFSPLIVTSHINPTGVLQLYTVNDQLSPVENTSVVIRVFKYDSPDFKPVFESRIQHNIDAAASQLIQNISVVDYLVANGCGNFKTARNTCFFHFVVQIKNSSLSDSVAISPENYHFLGPLKNMMFGNATLTIISVTEASPKSYSIIVKSDNIALFVWLDAHSVRGRFSENGFMQVTAEKTVWFYPDVETNSKELFNALTVTHFRDKRWLD